MKVLLVSMEVLNIPGSYIWSLIKMKIPGLGYLNHNWVCSYIVAIGTFVAEKTH